MSTKHTAGPWVHRVMTMPRKVWAALGRREIQIVAKNGNVIAAVWCADDRPGEKEANAVLIAAVTDLLTFAESYLEMANEVTNRGASARPTIAQLNALFDQARAAIAKATGDA